MDRYGMWNARGTTNSEYGRFSFLQNMQHQQAPTSQHSGFNLSGHQSNAWGTGHGQHECQNVHQGYYGQQQGYTHQNYYHQPNCPNAAQNQAWMQQQQQGQGQEQDGSQPRFTIQVGEEAAAAALGGKAEYHNHFAMAQNQGAPMTMLAQQGNDECGGSGQPEVPHVEVDSSTVCAQPPSTSAGENASEPGNAGGQGDSSLGNIPSESGNEKSAPPCAQPAQPQAPKPGKWKGLNSVKYGRHVVPSQMRGGDSNQMQQLQSRMQHLQFNPQEMNPSNRRMVVSKSATAVAAPSGGQDQQGQPQQSGAGGARGGRNRSAAAEKAHLCGKCNKCKSILPPDMGPSTLTFPSRSSMNLKSTNTGSRSKHYLGRQDAQNFRAVQYRELK